MAVQSTMVPLGTALPTFTLPDVNGAQFVSTEMPEAPALVTFLCNHCPYVRHIEIRLGELLASFPALATVGICTNDSVAYPEDAPVRLAEQFTHRPYRRLSTSQTRRPPRSRQPRSAGKGPLRAGGAGPNPPWVTAVTPPPRALPAHRASRLRRPPGRSPAGGERGPLPRSLDSGRGRPLPAPHRPPRTSGRPG
jgi:hypothetical protein